MRIVVDTNVLLPSLSPKSAMHWVFAEILAERWILCVTTDILSEYEEVFERRLGVPIAQAMMDLIMTLPNLLLVEKYYFWQAVEQDPDDNKFLDCAVAARAKYLVSDDKHFNPLRKRPLFEVEIVRYDEFEILYKKY
jgi:putative PIN family toxin of toxin-antitoxin system